MQGISLEKIEAASRVVYEEMQPTPQYCWPLLCKRLGTEVWVKHENHTPIGAFKIRGGLVYFSHLAQSSENPKGVISATKGNHGQSITVAASRYGIPTTIVVPHGNSLEKNEAMRAQGAKLIEHGDDFQTAREFAINLASEKSLKMIPSFDPLLVTGVATYSLELLTAVKDLDVAYVPIGLGSGICGMLAVRNALKLKTQIVGVVSAHARAYLESFSSRRAVELPVSTKIADGLACRVPEQAALEQIWNGVERIVEVTDNEIADAIQTLYECTHNVCEGSGAAAYAAAVQESTKIKGLKVAVIASGGNIDRDVFASVLKREASS
ncbi:MAG: L-threonine dehydratase catabolic TdcB [Deltaproteobacteria bacterium]|jgi:threonine dehydratase|nr:L-threonine dehydratase catabolic TdcB [Deltaproteobacteria bacterium]